MGPRSWFKGLGSGVQGHGFRVLGLGSWVLSWVGGPPKGLQSAAVTLVTSSWRVELDHIKVKLRKYKAK